MPSSLWFHLYDILCERGKHIETENKFLVSGIWRERGLGSAYLIDPQFPFRMTQTFWNSVELMIAQCYGMCQMPLKSSHQNVIWIYLHFLKKSKNKIYCVEKERDVVWHLFFWKPECLGKCGWVWTMDTMIAMTDMPPLPTSCPRASHHCPICSSQHPEGDVQGTYSQLYG